MTKMRTLTSFLICLSSTSLRLSLNLRSASVNVLGALDAAATDEAGSVFVATFLLTSWPLELLLAAPFSFSLPLTTVGAIGGAAVLPACLPACLPAWIEALSKGMQGDPYRAIISLFEVIVAIISLLEY